MMTCSYLCLKVLQKNTKLVITSYSIHYTKLYENVSDGYQVVETVPVSSFLKDYKLFSDQYFPKLKMQDPKTLAYPGLDWALFRPVEFPREVNVIHKIPQGFMDLSFTLTTMDRVQELFGPLLGSDMSIRETGKACVIRMNVPAIVRRNNFV